MDWLESVIGRDQASKEGKEDRRQPAEEEPVEVVRVTDDNLLLMDLSEIVSAIKGKNMEPPELSEEEMAEYTRFMSLIMPKKAPSASSRKRNIKTKK